MFDLKTLERVHKMWNKDEMVRWEVSFSTVSMVLAFVFIRLGIGPRITSWARGCCQAW